MGQTEAGLGLRSGGDGSGSDQLQGSPRHAEAGIVPAGHSRAEPSDQAAAVVGNSQGKQQQSHQVGGMPRLEAMPLQLSHAREGKPAEQF